MKLSAAKQIFFKIRASCEIIIRKHAFADYPKRGFSKRELISLIRKDFGRFEDNKSPDAISKSFLFFPKDEQGRECKLVILIEIIEIEGLNSTKNNQAIIVCSAYRRVE